MSESELSDWRVTIENSDDGFCVDGSGDTINEAISNARAAMAKRLQGSLDRTASRSDVLKQHMIGMGTKQPKARTAKQRDEDKEVPTSAALQAGRLAMRDARQASVHSSVQRSKPFPLVDALTAMGRVSRYDVPRRHAHPLVEPKPTSKVIIDASAIGNSIREWSYSGDDIGMTLSGACDVDDDISSDDYVAWFGNLGIRYLFKQTVK